MEHCLLFNSLSLYPTAAWTLANFAASLVVPTWLSVYPACKLRGACSRVLPRKHQACRSPVARGTAHTQEMLLQRFPRLHESCSNVWTLSQGPCGVHRPTSPFDPRRSWEASSNRPIKRSQSNPDETGLGGKKGTHFASHRGFPRTCEARRTPWRNKLLRRRSRVWMR